MKKKLLKSKRPTHFLRPKKSSPLSQIALKKTPKRKIKQNLKKLFSGIFVFLSIFSFSLIGLWIVFKHTSGIISPIPNISNVLGASSQQDNSPTLIAQCKEALQKKNVSYDSVVMQGVDLSATLSDGTQVIFSTDKDILTQIDSLQVTMDNLTIEGKRISRVDMRFERPVVTFK